MYLTPKQEKFCQKYIELGNASEAYRQTYNSSEMKSETVNRKAKFELDKDKIRARIQELQDRNLKRHDVTVDSLVGELEEARAIALQTEQASAAVSATMGKAKLHGLLVDNVKAELSGKDGKPIEWREVSDDEINARIAELSLKI